MTVPRETPPRPLDPIEEAIVFALRRIAERKERERAEARAKMTVVDGGKRGGQAA